MSGPGVNGFVRRVRGAEGPRVEGEKGRTEEKLQPSPGEVLLSVSASGGRHTLSSPFHTSSLQHSAHFCGVGEGWSWACRLHAPLAIGARITLVQLLTINTVFSLHSLFGERCYDPASGEVRRGQRLALVYTSGKKWRQDAKDSWSSFPLLK